MRAAFDDRAAMVCAKEIVLDRIQNHYANNSQPEDEASTSAASASATLPLPSNSMTSLWGRFDEKGCVVTPT